MLTNEDIESFLNIIYKHPVEEGYVHQLESKLQEEFAAFPKETKSFLLGILADETISVEVKPDIVLLTCRMPAKYIESWFYEVIAAALVDPELEMRGAAIDAVERLGTQKGLELLERQVEPEKYLLDYKNVIIKNLTEELAEPVDAEYAK
jgi:hypothetical protein